MNKISGLLSTCALAAISAAVFPTAALAQSEPEAADETPQQSEGIVVTARRRAEDISRVPTTVSALGAEALAERSIATQSDLQAAVPGLVIRETQSNNQLNYSIRGQTVDAFSGSSTAVVPYVNEVPFVAGGVASFFDLQSIQVLKGPQGTLFGRNATGGAVLSQTAKPQATNSGNIRVGYGNFNAFNAEGAVNIPWVDETVLFRAAFKIARRDGYIDNVYTGPVFAGNDNSELGKLDSTALRGTLLVRPSETIENTTMVQYERTRGNNSGTRIFSFNTCGTSGPDGTPLVCGAHFLFGPQLDANIGFPGAWAAVLAANPGYDPTGIQGVLARQNNELGFWQVNEAMPSVHRGEDWAVTNTTTIELSDKLNVKNIFGYSSTEAIDATGQTGTPYLLISNFDINRPATDALRNFANQVSNSSYSNELQLQGTAFNDGVDYIIGGYFQKFSNRTIFPQSYFGLSPVIPPVSTTSHFSSKDTTYAAFAHATLDLGQFGLLEGLKFSFGGRYAWEKIELEHERGGTFFGLTTPPAQFDRASWNIGLEYQANSDVLVYLIARESWRAGGINGVAPPALSATITDTDKFLPEVAQDFETGLKFSGLIGGMRSHVYLSAYTMQVQNVQRTLFPNNPVNPALGSIALTVNVPEARIKGLEADVGLSPADWLEVGLNGSHTDAKFTQNIARPFGVLTRFGPVADVPRWAGSVYATVTIPITDTADVKVRGDVYSQSSFFFSNTAFSITPQTELPGYTIANFRLDVNNLLGEGLGLGLWVRNAFNEEYYVGGLAQGSSLGINSANVGRPRMYGVELRAEF